jgi:hypothetical protein
MLQEKYALSSNQPPGKAHESVMDRFLCISQAPWPTVAKKQRAAIHIR